MFTLRILPAALAASLAFAAPLMAEDHPPGLHLHDAYARAAGKGKSGAVFLVIHNNTDADERLADVRADVAKRVELHTHKDMGDGVMKMMHLPEGFAIPAGEMHELARGGDHVMLMGLTADFKTGDSFPMTLVFEHAGEITLTVPVDNERQTGPAPMHGAEGSHEMMHGQMGHAVTGGN